MRPWHYYGGSCVMIRSFVALDLPVPVLESLGELIRVFKKSGAPVAWVKPERIHLTLKFLGNVSPATIPKIQEALEEIAGSSTPFRLQPGGCGGFPSIRQMRVVWVGIKGDLEGVRRLHSRVEAALVPMGFDPEDRTFRPHLTLGRVKGRGPMQALQEALLANQGFRTEAFDVADLVLYKSDLYPGGAHYTPLYRARFAEG